MTASPRSESARRIAESGIIAILRVDLPVQEIIEMGDALMASPVAVAEVPLNTPAALEVITALRERYGSHMLMGAGTVRTPAQVRPALDAGAQFLVAPNFDMGVAMLAKEAGILYIPGVFTPTEVQVAVNAGCRMVKLFPNTLGPAYLRALRAPMDDVDFVPTGGVDVGNIAAFAKAGAAAVGVAGALFPQPWSMPEIILRARALRKEWNAGKNLQSD